MLFCIFFAHCCLCFFFETLQDLILKKMAADSSFSGLEGQKDEHNSGKGPFFLYKRHILSVLLIQEIIYVIVLS